MIPRGFDGIRGEGARFWVLRRDFPRTVSVGTWDAWLRGQGGTPLESEGGRAPVRTVDVEGMGEAVVRRYYHGGLTGPMTRNLLWGLRRPLRELEASERLREHGVATPEVLALYLKPAFVGLYRGCILTRRIPCGRNLREWLGGEPSLPEDWKSVLPPVARAVSDLHRAGCLHRDLNLGNLILSPERVFVLDLDGARLVRELQLFERGWNLLRLYRSLRKETGQKEPLPLRARLLFLKCYAAQEPRLYHPLRDWLRRRWTIQRMRRPSPRR